MIIQWAKTVTVWADLKQPVNQDIVNQAAPVRPMRPPWISTAAIRSSFAGQDNATQITVDYHDLK
ncbi:MAG: hypothetical protein ABJF23_16820 [Bryobacteraceae bacterium]